MEVAEEKGCTMGGRQLKKEEGGIGKSGRAPFSDEHKRKEGTESQLPTKKMRTNKKHAFVLCRSFQVSLFP
jgi:hypothetical protein